MSHMYQDLRELQAFDPQPSQNEKLQAIAKLFGHQGQLPAQPQTQALSAQNSFGQVFPGLGNGKSAQQFAQQMMGQPAQNAVQGYGQLATGIGMGLANYQKQGEQFPAAPGGGDPSLMTGLANFLTGRNNGGLK